MKGIEKPASVAADPIKSQKWDEVTAGRNFHESDVPTLELLCYWHWVVTTCMSDLDEMGGQLFYESNLGDIKAMPQLEVIKKASGEIRQLNKQLGINDEANADSSKPKETMLYVIQRNRQSRAENRNTAKAG